MAGGILTCGQVRIRAFRAEEGDTRRVRIGFVQMLLEQRLLGQNGVFDDELEQPGDVMGIEVMRFAELNQTFQQIALAVDITYRAMGVQLGFAHFNGKRGVRPAAPAVSHPAR
jgi:hypothetical protein